MDTKFIDWHTADIIAALRKRGTSLAAESRRHGLSSSTLYSNFRVHFQYRSHYTSPNTGGWFNAVGNYTHARIAVSPSISVGIDTKAGTLSVAIGLELHGLKDIRGAEVEMHHIPG